MEIGQSAADAVSSSGNDLASAAINSGMGGGSKRGGMPGMRRGRMPGMPGGMPGMPGMRGDMPGMRGGMPGMRGGPGMRDMPGKMGRSGLDPKDQQVLNARYVDQNKKPIMAGEKHPYAEFKMMPIRMGLEMDQRKIPKLLVECANSTMPVEVQRIRIDISGSIGPSAGGRMGGSGMNMGNRMSGRMEMGGHMGMEPSRMPGGLGMSSNNGLGMQGYRMQGRGNETEEVDPQKVSVEIVGIIYIYNPPDRKKVGTGTAMDEATATPGAPGAPGTPAASPPAAAPPGN